MSALGDFIPAKNLRAESILRSPYVRQKNTLKIVMDLWRLAFFYGIQKSVFDFVKIVFSSSTRSLPKNLSFVQRISQHVGSPRTKCSDQSPDLSRSTPVPRLRKTRTHSWPELTESSLPIDVAQLS